LKGEFAMARYIGGESDEFPYAAMTYIEVTFPDGSSIYGSGALVGANDVLTAAHIIYDPQRGGQAVDVTVVPGRDGNRYPFDSYQGVSLDYYKLDLDEPNSIRQSESQKDLAVIGLEYAVGDELGWFELVSFSQEGDYKITGYPGEYFDAQGARMVESGGTVTQHQHYDLIELDGFATSPGNSGSPVWLKNGNTIELAGIVSTLSWAALVEASYVQLQSWINGNDSFIKPVPASNAAPSNAVENEAPSQPEQDTNDTVQEPVETAFTPTPRLMPPEAAPEPTPEPQSTPEPQIAPEPAPTPQLETSLKPQPTPQPSAEQNSGQPSSPLDFFAAHLDAKGWAWPDTLSHELETMDSLMRFPQFQEILDPVIRLYTGMLGRLADREGLEYWVKQLNSGHGLDELATAFVNSTEFSALVNRYGGGNEGFVDALYQNVLGREPDNQGRVYWLNQMIGEAGDDKKAQIALSFTNSDEYITESFPLVQATKLLTWGVNLTEMNPASLGFGSEISAQEVQLGEAIVRLYSGVLGRPPDTEGFDHWLEAGQRESGLVALAEDFLHSEEFLNGADELSTAQVLEKLYRQVLEREADSAGERYWMNQLEKQELGMGDLVLAFTESQEFQQRSQAEVDDYLDEYLQTQLVGVETDLESYLMG